jgi:hypothetical protein
MVVVKNFMVDFFKHGSANASLNIASKGIDDLGNKSVKMAS